MNNKTRKNIKNRQKYRGGLSWKRFWKMNEKEPATTDTKKTSEVIFKVNPDGEEERRYEGQNLGKKNVRDEIKNRQTKMMEKKLSREKTGTVLQATAVLSGVTAIMASTVVLAPIAGLLGGVLLIANKVAEIYINNLTLRLLMEDVLSITMDIYMLYDLIVKISKYLEYIKYTESDRKPPKEPLKIRLSTIYKEREKNRSILLTEKVVGGKSFRDNEQNTNRYNTNQTHILQLDMHIRELAIELLRLCDDDTIKELAKETDLVHSGFEDLIQKEYERRQNRGFGEWINHKLSRTTSSNWYKQKIMDSLVMIDSYVVLLFDSLFFTIKKIEILDPPVANELWTEIIFCKEFQLYIRPVPDEIFESAMADAEEYAAQNETGNLRVLEIVDNEEKVNNQAEGKGGQGGGGDRTIHTREGGSFKRTTVRRRR